MKIILKKITKIIHLRSKLDILQSNSASSHLLGSGSSQLSSSSIVLWSDPPALILYSERSNPPSSYLLVGSDHPPVSSYRLSSDGSGSSQLSSSDRIQSIDPPSFHPLVRSGCLRILPALIFRSDPIFPTLIGFDHPLVESRSSLFSSSDHPPIRTDRILPALIGGHGLMINQEMISKPSSSSWMCMDADQ